MSIDYIVSSLPALAFGMPAPLTLEKFAETAPEFAALAGAPGSPAEEYCAGHDSFIFCPEGTVSPF